MGRVAEKAGAVIRRARSDFTFAAFIHDEAQKIHEQLGRKKRGNASRIMVGGYLHQINADHFALLW